MLIELKRISYNERLSEETSAFSADVWVDGKKQGTCRNGGTGGPTMIYPDSLSRSLNGYGATLPRRPYGHGLDGDYAQNGESLLDDLLMAYLTERDVKRALSRKCLFVKNVGEGIRSIKMGTRTAAETATILNKPEYRAKYDVKLILNLMPIAEAMAIVAAHEGAL